MMLVAVVGGHRHGDYRALKTCIWPMTMQGVAGQGFQDHDVIR